MRRQLCSSLPESQDKLLVCSTPAPTVCAHPLSIDPQDALVELMAISGDWHQSSAFLILENPQLMSLKIGYDSPQIVFHNQIISAEKKKADEEVIWWKWSKRRWLLSGIHSLICYSHRLQLNCISLLISFLRSQAHFWEKKEDVDESCWSGLWLRNRPTVVRQLKAKFSVQRFYSYHAADIFGQGGNYKSLYLPLSSSISLFFFFPDWPHEEKLLPVWPWFVFFFPAFYFLPSPLPVFAVISPLFMQRVIYDTL